VPPSGSVVEPGDFITYTVTVQNSGSGPATGVVVSDTLDTDVLLVSALASTGTVTTGPPLRVDGFNLAAGDTMTVTIVVTVTNVPSGTLITNQASVTSTESVVLGVSNVVTHVISNTSVVAPNFTLTKSADPPGGTLVTQGDTITYTIVAVNSGGPATNVVITDVIPVGTSYVLGSATTNLGTANFDGTQVTISATNFLAGSTLTATFRVTVMTSLTTTITNIAVLASDQTAPQNSNPVSHPVQGVGTSRIYLPSIYKNFIAPFASLAWVGQTEDRVRLVDGSDPLAFTPDGQNDGAFQLTVSVGSTGPKTVSSVQLTSSQGAGVEWDTLINGLPVLGIFDGGARLNNADGTIDRLVNGQVTVTLYASDDGGGRFPTDTYDYTVIVTFTDGTTLVAQARIPASPPSPPPPPPPPLPTPPPPPSPTPVSLRPTSPSDYVS
jgi:uncharacterized repeat protein (TIGR01451 family)